MTTAEAAQLPASLRERAAGAEHACVALGDPALSSQGVLIWWASRGDVSSVGADESDAGDDGSDWEDNG
jgi:hypothetical protein